MKLTDFFLLKGLDHVLNGKKTDEVVKQSAELIDKYLDERFGGKGSDELKRSFSKNVILPLARALYQDDKTQYLADLSAHKDDILHEPKELK